MNRQRWLMVAVVLGLVGGTAVILARLQGFQKLGQPGVKVAAQPVFDPEGKVVATNRVELPERVLTYESELLPVEHLVLDWLPKDTTYGQRRYRAPDGFEASVNVVLMGSDRTSIHKPQYCLTGAGWRIEQTEKTFLTMSQPYSYQLPAMQLILSRDLPGPGGTPVTRRGMLFYWFVADNQLSADHLERMWWMARDVVRDGVWQRWAYVAFFSVCVPGQEEATVRRMRELIAAAVPQFQLAAGAPLAQAGR